MVDAGAADGLACALFDLGLSFTVGTIQAGDIATQPNIDMLVANHKQIDVTNCANIKTMFPIVWPDVGDLAGKDDLQRPLQLASKWS